MKAFRFRLATVARIRALEERVAADRFMAAQRILRQEQESARAAEAGPGHAPGAPRRDPDGRAHLGRGPGGAPR